MSSIWDDGWMKGGALASLLLLVPGHGMASATTISVAVASNFYPAALEIARRYAAGGGDNIQLSSGSTGKLYAQIVQGAPFQLFLAADAKRPEQLAEQGLALADTRFTYATGKLVLWAAADTGQVGDAAAVLGADGFKRLAIANPVTAPYGFAAQEFLQNSGVLERLRTRLVRGENITQTFQYVASGNAELGLVSYAQIKLSAVPGKVWPIAQSYYTPLVQQGIILKSTGDRAAVARFVAYLRSPEIQTMLQERYGYGQ